VQTDGRTGPRRPRPAVRAHQARGSPPPCLRAPRAHTPLQGRPPPPGQRAHVPVALAPGRVAVTGVPCRAYNPRAVCAVPVLVVSTRRDPTPFLAAATARPAAPGPPGVCGGASAQRHCASVGVGNWERVVGGLQGGKARGFGVTAPVATASGGRGWRGGTAMPTAAGVPPAYLPRPASRHVGRGGGGRRSRRWRVGLPLAFAAVRRTERATRTGGEMAGRDRYMRGATCPCTCLHGAAGVLWTSGGHHRRRR
jgi:hypothetical protein